MTLRSLESLDEIENIVETLLDKALIEKSVRKEKQATAYQVVDKILGENDDEIGCEKQEVKSGKFSQVEDSVCTEEKNKPTERLGETRNLLREVYLTKEKHQKIAQKECEQITKAAKTFNEKLTRRMCNNRVENKIKP